MRNEYKCETNIQCETNITSFTFVSSIKVDVTLLSEDLLICEIVKYILLCAKVGKEIYVKDTFVYNNIISIGHLLSNYNCNHTLN